MAVSSFEFWGLKFFLACEIKSILCVKSSIINHAKIFCKSCFVCCETSSLVKFSLIICRKVENSVISCRTFICLDVSFGEICGIGFSFSNIEI